MSIQLTCDFYFKVIIQLFVINKKKKSKLVNNKFFQRFETLFNSSSVQTLLKNNKLNISMENVIFLDFRLLYAFNQKYMIFLVIFLVKCI